MAADNLQGKKHTAGKQQAIASWRYLFIFFSASCFSVKGSRLWNVCPAVCEKAAVYGMPVQQFTKTQPFMECLSGSLRKHSCLWNTRHSRHLPGAKGESISVQSGHIGIHKDKVAYASGHDEQVEYFVGTEALVL